MEMSATGVPGTSSIKTTQRRETLEAENAKKEKRTI